MVSIIEREARLRELSKEEIVERALEKIYPAETKEPRTEFERSLCAMGFSYGVSLPDSAIFPEWLNIVQSAGIIGKQVHDTRIVAVCLTHGVGQLLTFNSKHFVRLAGFAPGLQMRDPHTI